MDFPDLKKHHSFDQSPKRSRKELVYLSQVRDVRAQVNIESMSNSDEAGFKADENISVHENQNAVSEEPETSRALIVQK
jgi:hypothetical protein